MMSHARLQGTWVVPNAGSKAPAKHQECGGAVHACLTGTAIDKARVPHAVPELVGMFHVRLWLYEA